MNLKNSGITNEDEQKHSQSAYSKTQSLLIGKDLLNMLELNSNHSSPQSTDSKREDINLS